MKQTHLSGKRKEHLTLLQLKEIEQTMKKQFKYVLFHSECNNCEISSSDVYHSIENKSPIFIPTTTTEGEMIVSFRVTSHFKSHSIRRECIHNHV